MLKKLCNGFLGEENCTIYLGAPPQAVLDKFVEVKLMNMFYVVMESKKKF